MTEQAQKIELFFNECLEGTDLFLVDFKLKPTNNYKFYVDSDSGFTLEKSVNLNRKLKKMIEEAGLYPEGDYSIEVSSPGLDAPLKLHRQYLKNIGRKLLIEWKDEEQLEKIGKLIQVDEDGIVLEDVGKVKKTKEQETAKQEKILFTAIKKAFIQIEF
ncbi:MAG: ribosome maturation factor [Chitinophagaceae bacterium]